MTAVQTFTPDRPTGAPPVLLLHGFASSGRQDWVDTGIAAELAAAGRVVVVPDLPGHGGSPVPAEAAGAPAVAAALLALAGDGPVDVVGYSLGARLAWELPELAPDRVRAVVLGGLSPFEPFAALDVAALRAAVAGGEPGDPMTGMIAAMIAGASGGVPERAAGLVRLVEGLRATPFEPKGWAGRTPPVFVAGAEDMMTSGIENVVALAPGARLVTVPGDHRGALAGQAFRDAVAKALAT
ncbi:alpha/beta fold hydrolase [Nonomuraea spiralis]|uniref:Alpha/beta fold hydrolase n=1 Tax=Nonomuraea spiralis TaxID=46182 RepID=A0ABV5ILZ5_9ACTN|nr:alpha/beta hydrolase [Nonomuraea spiralis]GGT01977.1 alpha/beta hydrolase [Nonomuraea spiralis]